MEDITPEVIAEKERRNTEAEEELQRIGHDRVRKEQSDALALKNKTLDDEYERIQRAIAFAKGVAPEPPAVVETETGTEVPVTEDDEPDDDSETVDTPPSFNEGN